MLLVKNKTDDKGHDFHYMRCFQKVWPFLHAIVNDSVHVRNSEHKIIHRTSFSLQLWF